ncbi:cobyrinate a,c-diamide synthase [Stappia sp.]|uniref:cobyrinate a,c-diamide synthase n=1 Tax=Stappia sp. TaxID=1870903 RepID=UPI003A98D658
MSAVRGSGLVIAAPSSGAGKTTLTLALLRALARRGLRVASAKTGPDYIDPAFHAAASGRPCVNLDPFAMRSELLGALAARQARDADILVVEGVMGLFDGAADGTGSTADLAARLSLPAVLVVDAAKQSQSVAALVRGFRDHRTDIDVAGVILNRTGSPRHETMLRAALDAIGMPVLGAVARDAGFELPERHLGLVQAGEHGDLDAFLDHAATRVAATCDLDALIRLARPLPAAGETPTLSPPGQRIAIARDTAFAFSYPHLVEGWRALGAEITFFSPLADEAPDSLADAVYLPGGYPELHAARIAEASAFRSGMQGAAARGALVYGECGGYMVLGDGLVDAHGARHAMLGLLPLETSFATRKRHLGYRRLLAHAGAPWQGRLTGHEFHYSTLVREGEASRLFEARGATGASLGDVGLRVGRVMGSYIHLIDRA